MNYKLFIVKYGQSNRGIEIINYHGNIRNIKLDGRLSHSTFDRKIIGRLIKSKALLLKVKLHLYLE